MMNELFTPGLRVCPSCGAPARSVRARDLVYSVRGPVARAMAVQLVEVEGDSSTVAFWVCDFREHFGCTEFAPLVWMHS